MEVNHTPRKLLVCGSHDNGQCWFVDLDDLGVTGVGKSMDANDMDGFGHRVFVGPPPYNRPVMRYAKNQQQELGRKHQLGLTHASRWVVASPNAHSSPSRNTFPIFSVRDTWNIAGKFAMGYAQKKNATAFLNKSHPNFYFDVLDGFCNDSECFFLTLQQESLNNTNFTSRIASVCQDNLFPYVEHPLEKKHFNNTYFNRVIAMTLGKINAGGTFPADFALVVSGNAESPSSNHLNANAGLALGFVDLHVLTGVVNKAREECAKGSSAIINIPDWYRGDDIKCRQEIFALHVSF
jgi:hypothetical protein